MPLHVRILIGVLIGAASGIASFLVLGDSPALDGFIRYVTQPVGQIFLRLIFMLVIPLLFSALVLGIVGLGDVRRLGRMGLRTLVYTVVVSSIAVLIGITVVNVLRPGDGMSAELRERLVEGAAERASALGQAQTAKT
jgi:Na+/H+-dicarboxylate symporter